MLLHGKECKMNIGIVLAGGKGTRFGADLPKQFVEITGMPLIACTVKKLLNCNIDVIYIVCIKDYVNKMEEIIKEYDLDKVENVIIGGNTRHESIRNAINYLIKNGQDMDNKIIIHNANMPLVSVKNVNSCIELCDGKNVIVTSAAECNGYFYQIDNDSNLKIGPDRKCLLHAKVPETLTLKTANELYNDPVFLDKKYESYTAGMLGIIKNKIVKVSICESTNMKITTREDYELVETYLKNEKYAK